MEHAPPRRNLDRDQLDAGTDGGGGMAKALAVVLRRVELPERRKSSPAVRAARVLDGAASGACVVERHPAGDEACGDDPVAVAVVLMEAEGLRARWLPEYVILSDARAWPSRQRRAQASHLLFEHDPRNGPVGLPAVADLPRAIRRVPPLAPVPFV